ncbi:helix-turn-helix domain-containing protein [Kibdelosporangium philippinense]|uniref:Helix-turn-helix domain-containing protein n=1 Tax=Kibdelosporangium philippinense TaxID=211113 RepID=A0ABS8Z3Q8_9PSEU|nr:helix-turn-helix domain-containing protein [Kibdelosporangium philippinense]MCE7002566.1 helix-turn-helix domain-containing protein [Kibdelosporangium philippinense]
MDDKAPFVLGGRPLHERLTADLPAYTELVLAEVTKRIPAYRVLPAEALSGDITGVIEQTLRAFATVLRTRQLPTAEDLEFFRESAARRAEEGIPIDVVLTAYHIGIQVLWSSMTPEVRPEEVHDVMAVNTLALGFLQLVTPAVGAGYLDERQTMFDDEHSARHTLLTALVNGASADIAAGQAGLRMPPCFFVVALVFDTHPDETASDVDAAVAGRRKLRRARAELERHSRGPVLSSLTPEGGIILLPCTKPAAELSTRDWVWPRRMIADISRVAGADLTAGVAAAGPDGVAAALAVARQVLDVAIRYGKPPGVYQLDDVLLEYQLSRPSEALDRLAAVLRPLEGNEELMQTLTTFLRSSGRRSTATELHVHPNTVDYRLRKILELTGLDATRTSDVSLLQAALAARLTLSAGTAVHPPMTGHTGLLRSGG